MIRPTWKPDSDEQRRIAEAVVQAFLAVDALEDKAWRQLKDAKDAGVSLQWMVERIGRSRSTAYRRLEDLSQDGASTNG